MTRAGQGTSPAVSKEAAVVARGSLVNLAAMVTGAALAFGLTVLVSRWLQPSGAGAFFELIALFTILSNTFELGADTGLTRWISRARAIGGIEDVRRIVMTALVPVLIIGTAAGAAMWVAAPELARLFLHGLPPATGATDVRIVAPLVALGALSSCIVDGARGFGRMWPYLAIEGLGKPLVRVVLVLAAVIAGWACAGQSSPGDCRSSSDSGPGRLSSARSSGRRSRSGVGPRGDPGAAARRARLWRPWRRATGRHGARRSRRAGTAGRQGRRKTGGGGWPPSSGGSPHRAACRAPSRSSSSGWTSCSSARWSPATRPVSTPRSASWPLSARSRWRPTASPSVLS